MRLPPQPDPLPFFRICPSTAPARKSSALSEKIGGGFFSLFQRLLLQLLIDTPVVTEWIEKLSITRPPEHVLDRHDDFRAPREGALENSIGVNLASRNWPGFRFQRED